MATFFWSMAFHVCSPTLSQGGCRLQRFQNKLDGYMDCCHKRSLLDTTKACLVQTLCNARRKRTIFQLFPPVVHLQQ